VRTRLIFEAHDEVIVVVHDFKAAATWRWRHWRTQRSRR